MNPETRVEDAEVDQDSLFGSPPPSPRSVGRPVSPALALPSANESSWSASSRVASAAANIQKNVGTIALPGSQPVSELPIHPLALSLNHGLVPRPPALPQEQSNADAPTATSSSNSVAVGSVGKTKKRNRPASSRSRSASIQDAPLEISFPDPSAPPPTHFLRNQENLLGKAGRVAGLNPSTLAHSRGSTPSNPILVDDNDGDTPRIGRRRNPSKSREPSQQPMDPTKLVQPTNEEIVSLLVGQKDIFPVLEGILKLISNGAQPKPSPTPRPTGFERRTPGSLAFTSTAPAFKKRKLNRVPAGASDWDVPFPFEEGEGPQAYHQNWERERGKRLIAELVKLIRVAARKAATKKYITQQQNVLQTTGTERDKRVSGYYRPETVLYAREDGQSKNASNDVRSVAQSGKDFASVSRPPTNPPPAAAPPSGDVNQTSVILDQLSSFVDSSTQNQAAITPSQPVFNTSDQNMFDTWMNFLDAFPVSFDGTGSTSTTTATPMSLPSTPCPDDFGTLPLVPTQDMETLLNLILNESQSMPIDSVINSQGFSPLQPFEFNSIVPSAPADIDTHPQDLNPLPPFELASITGDHRFDPSLPPIPSMGMNLNMTRPPSPLASGSSFGGSQGPTTPASANWDFSAPDIFTDGEGQEGMWRDSLWVAFKDVTQQGVVDGRAMDVDQTGYQDLSLGEIAPTRGMDKEKEVVEPATSHLQSIPNLGPPAFNTLLGSEGVYTSAVGGAVPPTSVPLGPSDSAWQPRKDDIIKRAKERRREVQDELNLVKRRLWETTIEQAALIHLTRKLDVE